MDEQEIEGAGSEENGDEEIVDEQSGIHDIEAHGRVRAAGGDDEGDGDGEEDEDGGSDEEEDGDDDGDRDEENDDEGGGEHEVYFDEETEGVIVAGKAFDCGEITRAQIGTFGKRVEGIAAKVGLPIVVVPAGDLTDTGPSPDENVYSVIHVGIEGGRGGTYSPDRVQRDRVLDALAKAKSIPDSVWTDIAAGLPNREKEACEEAEVGTHLTCVGPLSASHLVYGVWGTEERPGPGTYVRGQDMDQEPHAEGVWGVKVAYTQFEGPESEEVDFSDEAHAARVAELGEGHEGGYWIIARYD